MLQLLRRPHRGHAGLWAAATTLLVLGGVLASILGAKALASSDAKQSKLAFHLGSAEIAANLKLAVQHEEDLVIAASGFVTGNPKASAADFDRWAQSVQAIERYPELQVFGLVMLVRDTHLAAFRARIATDPIRPLGPQSVGPKEAFQILPPGRRPYYCLGVAGLARSAALFVPGGLDYCALAPTLITARDSGLSGYAPFEQAGPTSLGVETPVYRGGVVPATVTARRNAFLGWIGELLSPDVVLAQALAGHPNVAVIFAYESRFSHVAFAAGQAPRGGQSTRIALRVGHEQGLSSSREGWSVQTFGPTATAAMLANDNSLMLLVGGSLLSVTVGLLMFVLGTGRRRALSLVREKTSELSHQALHDALTGLPNRVLVLDRAQQILARVGREADIAAGALFIDIDGFKTVNDGLGHAAGDQLLRVVAARLQGAVRENDTVGRLGGDEFVVLGESSGELTLDLLADRLLEVLREPVRLEDGDELYSVSASIGGAVGHYTTPDALLRDADLALYAAKAAGKDRYALFDESMHMRMETCA